MSNKGLIYKRSRLVKGVGVNDAPFPTTTKIKSYTQWLNMLARCYVTSKNHASYIGCTVDLRWLSYMAFHEWFEKNARDGWHLDKDLLAPGNKVYGPDTCVMIPDYVNVGMIRLNARGWTITNDGRAKKYQVIVCGKAIGRFHTALEAESAWKIARIEHLKEVIARYEAESNPDSRVVIALRAVAAGLV